VGTACSGYESAQNVPSRVVAEKVSECLRFGGTSLSSNDKEIVAMDILAKLKSDPARKALIKHNFLEQMRNEPLGKEELSVILGQWYHPLNYFPNFLGRLISLCPLLEMKTTLSKILWQELGEGKKERAHEEIFIKTMCDVGFTPQQFLESRPLEKTIELLNSFYHASDHHYLQGLGYIFGTEAADLAMVSSIGKAVARYANIDKLPWVDIHITQEPDHQNSVDFALTSALTEYEKEIVLKSARQAWEHWINFFSGIEQEIYQTTG
jgi:pyrroloquinoline quinone (PQQ) biosynthesis protein C